MPIYDIYGNTVAPSGSTVTVEVDGTSFLSHGADVTGKTYGGLSAEYIAMVQGNYNAFMTEIGGDFNKIPIIVHTDQHAMPTSSVFEMCSDMVDWYEISRIINLGDTCSGTFSESQLASYRSGAESYLPLEKRIEVYGNHDIWDSNDDEKYTVSQKRLSPYFYNVDAKRHGNNGFFTIVDAYRKVKYLVVNNFEYPDTNYSYRRITTDQAKFIVEELSSNDGLDIILLAHQPLDSNGVISRDETYVAYNEKFLFDPTAHDSFMAMLAARKNNASGTFTDSEGVAHSYDFSNVSSNLLMSLHGHAHFEAYRTFENSITEFIFDRFQGNTFYFAYIDRTNLKFKCWKNETGVDALEISIA